MNVSQMAIKAYTNSLGNASPGIKKSNGAGAGTGLGLGIGETSKSENSFADTLKDSLNKVNEMQTEKESMIKDFASGKSQNVHELMISLQKAGLAMKMTSTVRGKVMESYKDLMRVQF